MTDKYNNLVEAQKALEEALREAEVSGSEIAESVRTDLTDAITQANLRNLTGNSHHVTGMAPDLASSEGAEGYFSDFSDVGMSCGFIPGDKGHCSFAEEVDFSAKKVDFSAKMEKRKQKWRESKREYYKKLERVSKKENKNESK